MCQSRLSQEEIYLACKFLYAGICIKEHASSRSVVVLCRLLFWLIDGQTDERVDQRYTEERLLVMCVIFSQLRLPNRLRTVQLLLLGLVLQQFSMARYLLIESKLPKNLWVYTLMASVYIRNCRYNKNTRKTPYESFTSSKPNLNKMHIFGITCLCYIQDKTK